MSATRHRQLAAIMFTDMVGYTALMQADEEGARVARLRHRTVLESALSAHDGQLLQYLGDGSMSIFPSAVFAVRAAIDVQRAARMPPPLPLRIGIHHGEVAFDEQGVYGDAVNVASRVQSMAPGGAVLVTGKVFDEIRNKADLPARLLGEYPLKNISQAVRVYAIIARGVGVPEAIGDDGASGAEPPAPDSPGVPATAIDRTVASPSLAARFTGAIFPPGRGRWRSAGRAAAIAFPAGALAFAALFFVHRPDDAVQLADLAILPFDVRFAADSGFANAITHLTADYLRDMPDLTLVPSETTQRWWLHADVAAHADTRLASSQLHARRLMRGSVIRTGEDLHVRFAIVDPRGNGLMRDDFPASVTDPMSAAERVAHRLATHFLLASGRDRTPGCPTADLEALIDFVNGERARYRGAWSRAVELYRSALERDPQLAEARWQLVNVLRWMPGETPDLRAQLDTLAAGGSCRLARIDSLTVAAQRGPPGLPRLRAYAAAVEFDRRSAYTALLYGEELFHRGPLAGFPAESTTLRLEAATALDPNLAPAQELLAWHHIRLGNADAALRAVGRVMELFDSEVGPGRVAYAPLLAQAYAERFEPERARRARRELLGRSDPDAVVQLAFAVRAGLAFDLPQVQLELGEMVSGRADFPVTMRADGYVASALALAALGRGEDALARFDSAMALRPTAQDRLAAAQWRVIPAALGYPLFPEAQRARGIADLRRMTSSPATVTRAAWTLAVDAYSRDDTVGAEEWRRQIAGATDSSGSRLLLSLRAMGLAHEGRLAEALTASDSLLAFDAGHRHGDPFARTVLHVQRGRWLQESGSAGAARRAWLWTENTDIGEWPAGTPQDAEVDWVFAPWASFLRGASALDEDEQRASACTELRHALRFWSAPEGGIRELRDRAQSLTQRFCLPD